MVFLWTGDLTADIADNFAALTKFGTDDNSKLDRLMAEVEIIVRSTHNCWLAGISRELLAKGYDFVTSTADAWVAV